jgi:hypothetical protein
LVFKLFFMNKVTIETRLTLPDFIKVNYILLFQKMSTKILWMVVLLMIVLPAFLAVNKGIPYNWLQSLIGIGLAGFYLLSTWLTAKKNFNSIPAISEPLTYEFTNERLTCTGTSSSSQTTWNNIYRVSETKDCLVIWKSRQVINLLPKRDIQAPQRMAIREMLQRNKVNNNLK